MCPPRRENTQKKEMKKKSGVWFSSPIISIDVRFCCVPCRKEKKTSESCTKWPEDEWRVEEWWRNGHSVQIFNRVRANERRPCFIDQTRTFVLGRIGTWMRKISNFNNELVFWMMTSYSAMLVAPNTEGICGIPLGIFDCGSEKRFFLTIFERFLFCRVIRVQNQRENAFKLHRRASQTFSKEQ